MVALNRFSIAFDMSDEENLTALERNKKKNNDLYKNESPLEENMVAKSRNIFYFSRLISNLLI